MRGVSAEQVRDIRIMARNGKDFAYIKDVLQWPDARLADVCDSYEITVEGCPAVPHRRGISTKPQQPSYARRGSRTETVAFQTTKDLRAAINRECAAHHMTSSSILHALIHVIESRGLWGDLIDPLIAESSSSCVASASHPKTRSRNAIDGR